MNQSIYDQAIASGCTPRLAEALASRTMRTGLTDKQYMARFKRFGDELAPEHAANVARSLRRNGVEVDSNTIYLPDMAQFEGDPRAAFRPSDGRGEIVRRCERMGAKRDKSAGRATMKFEWAKPEHDPLETAPAVADDLVMREVRDIVRANPDAAHEPLDKLKAQVIKKRSPSKGRKSNSILPARA